MQTTASLGGSDPREDVRAPDACRCLLLRAAMAPFVQPAPSLRLSMRAVMALLAATAAVVAGNDHCSTPDGWARRLYGHHKCVLSRSSDNVTMGCKSLAMQADEHQLLMADGPCTSPRVVGCPSATEAATPMALDARKSQLAEIKRGQEARIERLLSILASRDLPFAETPGMPA
eukprot:s501_g5.t1